jgi:hypothetical protein
MYMIHSEFDNFTKAFLSSDKVKFATNGQNFKTFSKSLTVSCLNAAYLNSKGRFRPDLNLENITEFGFFDLSYSHELAYEEEMKKLTLTQDQLDSLYIITDVD